MNGTHRHRQTAGGGEDEPPLSPLHVEELTVGPEVVNEQVKDPSYQADEDELGQGGGKGSRRTICSSLQRSP